MGSRTEIMILIEVTRLLIKTKNPKTLEIGRTHLSIIKGIHHKPIATTTPKRENLKAESLR